MTKKLKHILHHPSIQEPDIFPTFKTAQVQGVKWSNHPDVAGEVCTGKQNLLMFYNKCSMLIVISMQSVLNVRWHKKGTELTSSKIPQINTWMNEWMNERKQARRPKIMSALHQMHRCSKDIKIFRTCLNGCKLGCMESMARKYNQGGHLRFLVQKYIWYCCI